MKDWVVFFTVTVVILCLALVVAIYFINKKRKDVAFKNALKMVTLLIYLPPATDDVQANGRDKRDVADEAISQAQVMYSILHSIFQKEFKTRIVGQNCFSFEIVASNGSIKYYVMAPIESEEIIRQSILSAYPTARVEEVERENVFAKNLSASCISGGELVLKKDSSFPISTYEDTKRDASAALVNALANVNGDDSVVVQILLRPAGDAWIKNSMSRTQNLKFDSKNSAFANRNIVRDVLEAPFKVPESGEGKQDKNLSNFELDQISAIENKAKYPGFETLIRVVACSPAPGRADALLGSAITAFSLFDSNTNNGFKFSAIRDSKKLLKSFLLRDFPLKNRTNILNSVELASIFHLPDQDVIQTSQVERQMFKQVDGPAKLVSDGVLLGVNEFRGQEKQIRLSNNDRRRHTYVIGSTGMGKSVLLKNVAYQDIMSGRGFAFIDPHGDAVEDLLAMIPPERVDDVVYFDPSDIDNPIGMNMFEFETEEQKDLIIQEGINMLYSLFDPEHTGIFGPRGEHMFRNAALLLMSDPNGAAFIDIPKVFVDPELVKSKLKYVTDRSVYDYWTKEFPASQKSSDAGEVTTWFASKWGPFLSNTMMRNILGQTKSGFNLREIMDDGKIFLVNLSKGKIGETNSRLLGMILVMKFQLAAMSRADVPEEQRKDFCLFVDEFQNFSTESFESILSEARKFRMNLFVANQFLTQLTDKIKEGLLGNVGTIISGRLGITDAEMLAKAFAPTFSAEDLHKLPNYQAIATVMMHDMPTTPFSMKLLPQMGEKNIGIIESLKKYSAMQYGKPRTVVESEITKRQSASKALEGDEKTASKPMRASETRENIKIDDLSNSEQESARKASAELRKNDFLAGWKKREEEIGKKEEELPTEGFIKIR